METRKFLVLVLTIFRCVLPYMILQALLRPVAKSLEALEKESCNGDRVNQ
jgi:hypothetical protein